MTVMAQNALLMDGKSKTLRRVSSLTRSRLSPNFSISSATSSSSTSLAWIVPYIITVQLC